MKFSRSTKRFVRLFALVFLGLASLSHSLLTPVPTVQAQATITVLNGNDSGDGSLRKAIEDVSSGGTITFADDVDTITLDTAQLTINKNLTIDGNAGVTIMRADKTNSFRIFNITNAATDVTLTNLILNNGDAGRGRSGGGISNAGILTVTNSTLSSNTANGFGGGIFNATGATLTITNSTLEQNTNLDDGSSGNINQADGGGAITNQGTLIVRNSTFSDNESDNDGGGIYNRFDNTLTIVTGSTFVRNITRSSNGGGGISNQSSNVVVANSTFSGNEARAVGGNGGGIHTRDGTLLVVNSTVTDNEAWWENGDGITNSGGALTLVNTIVTDNADTTGSSNDDNDEGDLYVTGDDATLTIEGTNIIRTSNVDFSTVGGSGTILDVDPNLGPLQANGGPTLTRLPLVPSPAIDTGDNSFVSENAFPGVDLNGDGDTDDPNDTLETDQRGFDRISGDQVDIGAVEVQVTIHSVAINPASFNEGRSGDETTATVTVTRSGSTDVTSSVNITLDSTATEGDEYTFTFNSSSGVSFNENIGTLSFDANVTEATFTITVQGDDLVEADETITARLSNASAPEAAAIGGDTATLTIINDDTAGVAIAPTTNLAIAEGGSSATYTVVLTSEPTDTVSVTIAADAQLSTDSDNLTFITTNWATPQTVTVSAIDDTVLEGDHSGTISHSASSSDGNYNAITIAALTVAVEDNEAGVIIAESGDSTLVSESGTQDTYTMVLASDPTDTVTIDLIWDATTEAIVSPTTLTFTTTNWATPQTITVTGLDDAVDDGDYSATIGHNASSSDTDYNNIAIADVPVTVQDDDTAEVIIAESNGSTAVSESGTSDTYTVMLASEPTTDVMIDLTWDATTEAIVSPTTLIFTTTNWATPQTITVTGLDDAVDDGDYSATIEHSASSNDTNYNNITVADVAVLVADDDTAEVIITESGDSTLVSESGTQDTYTLVLTSEPTANVTIDVLSSDTGEVTVSPTTLTFTTDTWTTPQTVTVTGVEDTTDDGNQEVTISHSASGGGYETVADIADVMVTAQDNDGVGVLITQSDDSTAVSESGSTDRYTVVLTSEPTAAVTVSIAADAQLSTDATELTFTPDTWATPQTVIVSAIDDDTVEGSHNGTIQHTTSSADTQYAGITVAALTVIVEDNEAGALIFFSGGSTLVSESGTSDTYTLVLTSKPTANVTIDVRSSDTGEVTISPTTLTFTTDTWAIPQTVTVTGVDDTTDDGNQVVRISHSASSNDNEYNNIAIAALFVTVADNDDTISVVITESSDSTLVSESGTTDTYTLVLTSEPTANVTIDVRSSDTGEVTVSPTTLTFTTDTWAMPQTVTVTGVDDTTDDGNQVARISHSASSNDNEYNNIAIADIPVTVQDDDGVGVLITQSNGSTLVSESGTTDTYTVVLTSEPLAPVTIDMTWEAIAEAIVSPTTLTFTADTWATPQTITVTGVDDTTNDGDYTGTISHSASSSDADYNNIAIADVPVTVQDDDMVTSSEQRMLYIPYISR